MKYLGCFAGHEIESNGFQTIYCYTSIQKREIIGYFLFTNGCLSLKQIAICSEMTDTYSIYWVFTYEYSTNDYDTLKEMCLEITEKELLPYIQKCVENNIRL